MSVYGRYDGVRQQIYAKQMPITAGAFPGRLADKLSTWEE